MKEFMYRLAGKYFEYKKKFLLIKVINFIFIGKKPKKYFILEIIFKKQA